MPVAQIAGQFNNTGAKVRFINSDVEGNGITDAMSSTKLITEAQFVGTATLGTSLCNRVRSKKRCISLVGQNWVHIHVVNVKKRAQCSTQVCANALALPGIVQRDQAVSTPIQHSSNKRPPHQCLLSPASRLAGAVQCFRTV